MSTAIKDAALRMFTAYGYEGTSLAQITDEIGLKKQSIYAHFKGKDDLYLQVVREAFRTELLRMEETIASTESVSLHDSLYRILRSYVDSYQDGSSLKFYLRTAFFPPPHLFDEIDGYACEHIDKVSEMTRGRFRQAADQAELDEGMIDVANEAFAALLDAICVELVYGNVERTEKRLKAAWTVYWNGIMSRIG
ncbi:TetR/AcrR family transcriptional regulator [Paenibacillus sp. LHD-117]|uniref:TetR/AcrR family transcriptional regulator n=1 Tax=Paenibacillus sp. LHD-117 TaxID=3071412 RepID=UPI0027E1D7EA|nr:TetR/AcrR family transcriptional regulator [Paenibacillus sp. LHD-117]MDQ6419476.1 TetR/AcrR family transcriptional regulator [Paenibacillus sp. LHD-117]